MEKVIAETDDDDEPIRVVRLRVCACARECMRVRARLTPDTQLVGSQVSH